jgi:hypothetical protein
MSSKKELIGKTCVYCGNRPAKTGDHVFARAFFPKFDGFRDNLPQVPSCSECNTEKSKWENNIITLLQFTGDSLSATAIMLSDKIERNLDENKRLAREMVQGFFEQEVQTPSGLYIKQNGFTLSDDLMKKLSKWYKSLARAFYYKWKNVIMEKNWKCMTINPIGQEMHFTLLELISNSEDIYLNENIDCGWKIVSAESHDCIILTCIKFNLTVQYVITFKNRYMAVAKQFELFSC